MSSLFGVTSVSLNLTCSGCGKGFHAAVFGANSAGGASIICPSCNALVMELLFANDFLSVRKLSAERLLISGDRPLVGSGDLIISLRVNVVSAPCGEELRPRGA